MCQRIIGLESRRVKSSMCTISEGKELERVFTKYFDGREVDCNDSAILDKLMLSAYLSYDVKGGRMIAKAGPLATKYQRSKKVKICASAVLKSRSQE